MPSERVPHGLIARAPLLRAADVGLGRSGVSKRVARGALHRVHRGVYSLVPVESLTQESKWLAALMFAGAETALCRGSTAALYDVTRWPPREIHVTVPRYRRDVDGVRFYEARNLDPRDVTVHRGIPTTTIERMLVDLTDTLTAEELTNLIHEAAFRRRFSIPATRAAMARANGRRRLARLDEAIELWLAGSAGLKSRLEKAFFEIVVAAGLAKPIPNIHVAGAEVDAYWPDARLAVEIDGPNHARRPTLLADGSRDELLAHSGITVLRFSELDLRRPPDVVAALVRAGCRAA